MIFLILVIFIKKIYTLSGDKQMEKIKEEYQRQKEKLIQIGRSL